MELNEKQGNYNQPYKSEKKSCWNFSNFTRRIWSTQILSRLYESRNYSTSFSLLCIGGLIGFIEGIIYLTKSDEEFDRTYVQNQKEWF
jgi:hypothetical protein